MNEHGPGEIWKWANFLLLAGGIGYAVWKNAGPFFSARSREIRKGIAEAEDLRAQAEHQMKEVDARLANLENDIAALRREAAQEESAEAGRARQEIAADMAKLQAHAEREIASAGKAARLELKRHAASLALELAEQKIRARMTPESDNALVGRFVEKLTSE